MAQCTVIKLKTVDQRLTAVQQPVLASGDVGTVRVEYALDSYWDGYTASGTFYTGKKPDDVYEQQLTEGACVIPWEVLQEDGVLYIGLRGVDGAGLIKTAAPVRYRIEKGSPIGSATAKGPTPDVYQQMLETMREAEEIAQSVRDDADNGEFIGERGPAGPAGVYVGTEAPTNGETVWIDTDAESDAQIDVVAKVGQVLVVKAVDADGHPTELRAVDFPKAPAANWNANEGEEGHIEGRTHYIDKHGVVHKLDNKYLDIDWHPIHEEGYGGETVIFPEQKVSSIITNRKYDLYPGIVYDVHIGGVVYACTAHNNGGTVYLGNPTLGGGSASLPHNNEPFCLQWFGGTATSAMFSYDTTISSSASIKVTDHRVNDYYNEMPEGFLPKCAVKSVNGKAPDANGNVEVEGGGANIDVVASVGQTIVVEEVDADGKPTKWKASEFQERTHWSEEGIGTLVPHTVFKPILNPTLQMPVYMVPEFGLAVGKTYTVVYDGVEYPCTAVSGTLEGLDFISIGNAYLATGTQTSEPFIVAKVPYLGVTLVIDLMGGENHTIQIMGEKTIYHKPAPEYAPNEYRVSFLNTGVLGDNGTMIEHFSADWDELIAAINARKNIYADYIIIHENDERETYGYMLGYARIGHTPTADFEWTDMLIFGSLQSSGIQREKNFFVMRWSDGTVTVSETQENVQPT